MPFILFLVALAGFLIAGGYYLYCTFFGERLLARADVPGEVTFEVQPGTQPMVVTARRHPGDGAPRALRVELEREGSWVWSRDVRLKPSDEAVRIDDLAADRPGLYRIKAFLPATPREVGRNAAAVEVHLRIHQPRTSVYVLAGGMLAGGFVSLLVLLA